MKFMKAERRRAKLRLAVTGPSGSGKTTAALTIAEQLAKELRTKIAVIDSENGSASLYCDLCAFDVLELAPPYSPERYIEAIKAAESAGYGIIVIDSTTHEWSGAGGCLEINERVAKSSFQGNTWSAWSVTTPRHRAFIDAMLQSPAHIIATGRSKTETAQDASSKKKIVRLGMKTEQRDGFEYEFTVVLDLIHDGHYATATKDRTGIFSGDPKPVTAQTGIDLLTWLQHGSDEPAPAPQKSGPQDLDVIEGLGASDAAVLLGNMCDSEASRAAKYMARLDQDRLDAIWSFLKPDEQDTLQAAWPQGAPS